MENFNEWRKKLVHTQYKVILPDGVRLDKNRWTSHKGFNLKAFNEYIEEYYNHKYKSNERE